MKPVIIIPAYNPPKSFISLLLNVRSITSIPIIIIDDGSIPSIELENESTILLRNKNNSGKGFSLLRGFNEALDRGFSHAITMDADSQHDPNILQSFIEINDNIINTVWKWLHTSEHELQGIVGEINNKVIAFAHYRRMPSPLRGKDIGFLDDLYVLPECRGQQIGEQLIEQLKQISINKKWNLVRWITRDNNVRAKKVYDKVSNKTNWDVYELSS